MPAAGEMLLQLSGEIMHVDNRALDPDLGEAIEHMIDHRAPADLHERLGHRVGDRPHAFAETCGKHHHCVGHGFRISEALRRPSPVRTRNTRRTIHADWRARDD